MHGRQRCTCAKTEEAHVQTAHYLVGAERALPVQLRNHAGKRPSEEHHASTLVIEHHVSQNPGFWARCRVLRVLYADHNFAYAAAAEHVLYGVGDSAQPGKLLRVDPRLQLALRMQCKHALPRSRHLLLVCLQASHARWHGHARVAPAHPNTSASMPSGFVSKGIAYRQAPAALAEAHIKRQHWLLTRGIRKAVL